MQNQMKDNGTIMMFIRGTDKHLCFLKKFNRNTRFKALIFRDIIGKLLMRLIIFLNLISK